MRRTGYTQPVGLSNRVEAAIMAQLVDDLVRRRDEADLSEELDDLAAAVEIAARLARLPDDGCAFNLRVRGTDVPMLLVWHGDLDNTQCVLLSGAMPNQGREDETPTTIFCPLLLVDGAWQPAGRLSNKMGCVVVPIDKPMPDPAGLVAELRRPTDYSTRNRSAQREST